MFHYLYHNNMYRRVDQRMDSSDQDVYYPDEILIDLLTYVILFLSLKKWQHFWNVQKIAAFDIVLVSLLTQVCIIFLFPNSIKLFWVKIPEVPCHAILLLCLFNHLIILSNITNEEFYVFIVLNKFMQASSLCINVILENILVIFSCYSVTPINPLF